MMLISIFLCFNKSDPVELIEMTVSNVSVRVGITTLHIQQQGPALMNFLELHLLVRQHLFDRRPNYGMIVVLAMVPGTRDDEKLLVILFLAVIFEEFLDSFLGLLDVQSMEINLTVILPLLGRHNETNCD